LRELRVGGYLRPHHPQRHDLLAALLGPALQPSGFVEAAHHAVDAFFLKRVEFSHVRYWLAQMIRAIHSTSFMSIMRGLCAGFSECNSIILAVCRASTLAITSPSFVFTTTR